MTMKLSWFNQHDFLTSFFLIDNFKCAAQQHLLINLKATKEFQNSSKTIKSNFIVDSTRGFKLQQSFVLASDPQVSAKPPCHERC